MDTKKFKNGLEKLSFKTTEKIGTPESLIIHSFLFVAIFALEFFGVKFDQVLLILTTLVSLEAIYLSLFIQMTVNRNIESLEEVNEDIEEIKEEVKGLDVDVDEISEDLGKIQAKDEEDNRAEELTKITLRSIESDLKKLLQDIDTLKKDKRLI